MSGIKTPNWWVRSVLKESTGSQFLIISKKNDVGIYFDDVSVYDGNIVDEVRFSNDEGKRDGFVRGVQSMPDVIIEGLKFIEEHGELPDTDDDRWKYTED